jgi:hypothetical protein
VRRGLWMTRRKAVVLRARAPCSGFFARLAGSRGGTIGRRKSAVARGTVGRAGSADKRSRLKGPVRGEFIAEWLMSSPHVVVSKGDAFL